MASYFGFNSNVNTNSFFNSFFGSTSGTGSSNSNSSGSISFSDYAMIRSGTYKKLMKSYYSNVNNDETGSSTEISNEDKALEAKYLQTTKNAAQSLYSAAGSLKDSSLYQPTGADSEGKATYDYDKLYSKASDFVSSYNSILKSFDNVDTDSVLSKGVYMVNSTKSNDDLLSDIGITITSDNTLSINKEKFVKANINDIQSLFTGASSYGDSVATKASQIYSLSASNIATLSRTTGSAYTGSGNYNMPITSTYQTKA